MYIVYYIMLTYIIIVYHLDSRDLRVNLEVNPLSLLLWAPYGSYIREGVLYIYIYIYIYIHISRGIPNCKKLVILLYGTFYGNNHCFYLYSADGSNIRYIILCFNTIHNI